MTNAVATSRWSRLGAPALTRGRLLLAAVGIVAIAFRVYVYRSTLGDENSDMAVIGLMVRHAQHGHLTTFYWGMAYGGIQEILLTVPVFWIAGPSLLAMDVVPIVLDVVTAYLVWRVGRRTIGEPAAKVAAALYLVWPAWTVYEHMLGVGFYSSNSLYCALLLLLALRAKERPDALRVASFGLVVGVAFYQTQQIVPIVIPTALWLVWRAPRVLRWSWLAALLAVIGALPWIVWNARHGWASTHLNAGADFTYLHRLRIFFSPVFPEDLGLRIIDSERWILGAPLGLALYAGVFAVFGYGAVRARRRDSFLLFVVAASFPFLYALSPKAIVSAEPRYAVVLGPCVVLIAAQIASSYRRAAPLLVVAALLSAVAFRGADQWLSHHANASGPTSPRSIAPLIATLDELHVRRVFANYWVAYRLDFDTHERIVAVENGFIELVPGAHGLEPLADPKVLWPPYDRAVRSGPHAFVFFAKFLPAPAKLERLSRNGYVRRDVEGFVVYAPPASASA